MHPYLFIYFQQKKSLPCTLNPLDKVLLPFVAFLEVPVDCWMWECGDHMLNNVFPPWKSQLPERSQDGSEVLINLGIRCAGCSSTAPVCVVCWLLNWFPDKLKHKIGVRPKPREGTGSRVSVFWVEEQQQKHQGFS